MTLEPGDSLLLGYFNVPGATFPGLVATGIACVQLCTDTVAPSKRTKVLLRVASNVSEVAPSRRLRTRCPPKR